MELIYISNSVNVDELRDHRQFERRRTPKLANVGCVEWKWWAKRLRWWEAQISSSGWHHHSTWVKTHTTLFTPMFFEERSHLFLLVLFTFDDTLNYGCGVCLGDMYLRFIHLFIYCAIHFIPITFRWSSSRHCMSFKPIPRKLCAVTEKSILPLLLLCFCIWSSLPKMRFADGFQHGCL